jgi:fermentation-respiration switch protein FrsA (DUF1100 family)
MNVKAVRSSPALAVRHPHPMLSVVSVIVVFLAVIWLAQRSLIYFPDGQVPSPASAGLPRAENVTFVTDDGLELGAWFVPASEPSANRTILYFNGNAGNRAYRAILAARFAAHGFSTLLTDYRGYGGNPGLPSERGLARDARAALRYLVSRPDVDRSRVVYFGESLGAAVAVDLAVDEPPAALILRSPFSSLAAVGARHYPFLPVRWLLRDRYASIDRIGQLRSPLLVIAGDADHIVPLDDTEELFDASPEPKDFVVIEGADHNSEPLAAGPELVRAVVELLEDGVRAATPPRAP